MYALLAQRRTVNYALLMQQPVLNAKLIFTWILLLKSVMLAVPIAHMQQTINVERLLQEKLLLIMHVITQERYLDVLMDLELILELKKKMDNVLLAQLTAQDAIKQQQINALHAKLLFS